VREVIRHARHPYTGGLMGSIPVIGHDLERLVQIEGAMPRLTEIPPGCPFHPRRPEAFARCRQARPELLAVGRSAAACWLHDRAA
jgi:peptide/nickel transport system ATP-binding protein